ncbi:MAG: DUF488 family protein [Halodesulfovibrio sp.]
MNNIYTIGFSQKNAERFFSLICNHKIKTLIDVRLNNVSQLAGFTKKNDLAYFLKKICNAGYIHIPNLAPTKEILDAYKKKQIDWNQYEKDYYRLVQSRDIGSKLSLDLLEDACLLCSEPTADKCHRRLAAEHLKTLFPSLAIRHL